jgi:hypothetical protein
MQELVRGRPTAERSMPVRELAKAAFLGNRRPTSTAVPEERFRRGG